MPAKYREIDFEEAIEWHLVNEGGYNKGNREHFDPNRGIDPKNPN